MTISVVDTATNGAYLYDDDDVRATVNAVAGDIVLCAGRCLGISVSIEASFYGGGTAGKTLVASDEYDSGLYDSWIYVYEVTSPGTVYAMVAGDDITDENKAVVAAIVYRSTTGALTYVGKGTERSLATAASTLSLTTLANSGINIAFASGYSTSSRTASWSSYSEDLDYYNSSGDFHIGFASDPTATSCGITWSGTCTYRHMQHFTFSEAVAAGLTIYGVECNKIYGVEPTAIYGVP
jgi:hypothetical protein